MPIRPKTNQQLQAMRAVFNGANRRFNSLLARKNTLMTAIESKKIVVEDPKKPGQTIIKHLTKAQITDYKRKLELVNNELLIAKTEFKEKEFNFVTAASGNTSITRGKRETIRKDLEQRKVKNIVKMLNAKSTEVISDLTLLKDTYSTFDPRFVQQIKNSLLKIIRKVNTSLPITNLSQNIVKKLFEGISKWDGVNLQIMEVV